ncbi:MAG: lytic transglycosylase domain-containing protein [Rhodanobacter sp.]|jgi:soluble lytic murein transglycosylase|nr:lytic transglycosylase domain-containing protein [Rhodanobacter sp.]
MLACVRRPQHWLSLILLGLACAILPLQGADRAEQRTQFRAALDAVDRPPDDAWKKLAAGLEEARYPLFPYLELNALRQRITRVDQREIDAFLARWPDSLPARDLRDAYLRELAQRSNWTSFRAYWKGSDDRDLICDNLQARLAAGAKLDYANDLDALWQNPRALPASCAPVVAHARAHGLLNDARVWARLERSAAAGRAEEAAAAAALLSGDQRAAADRYVLALRDPSTAFTKSTGWPNDARTRDALSYGIARHARRDSAAAEAAWATLETRFTWDATQKNRALNVLAVYRATSYSPDALTRLNALPAQAEDDLSREWRVRLTLASGDFKQTLAALDKLSDTQKADARWRYLRARMLMNLQRKSEAMPIFAALAGEASFHGFLAADWAEHPYTICARVLAEDAQAENVLAQQPDLERAFEFRELAMLSAARREWDFAMTKLDAQQRRNAVDLAYRRGWYDRAVFAFSADPDMQRIYEQRFPLGMETYVKAEAHNANIDPAWVYAIIRAESAWMTDAHSSADAYGLMQLLPSVAKQTAKSAGLPYSTAQDLFDARLSIQLGTRYLSLMARQYDGSPWLASAAYNAGVGAVGRWTNARGTLDPDLFVETIPYKETREYVARVLAFIVIYDWRMNGKVLSLSSRMPKIGQSYPPATEAPRKEVVCPTPAGTGGHASP